MHHLPQNNWLLYNFRMIIYPQDEIENNISNEDEILLQRLGETEVELKCVSSHFNDIAVVDNIIGRFLKFGDAFQAGEIETPQYSGNMPLMNYFFIPFLINKNIQNVLVLGLGSGKLAKDIESYFNVKSIDIVEIDDEVVNCAKEFFDFEETNKTKIHLQDARVYLRNTKKKYDLVILDLFAEDGMPYRFMTKEFLGEISMIMTDSGILGANIFSHSDLNSDKNTIFKSMIKTYNSVFSEPLLFPAHYANNIFYQEVLGFQSKIEGLINVIVFASKQELTLPFVDVQKPIELNNYLNDFHSGAFDTSNAILLIDEYEYDENFDNLFK